MVDLLKRWVPLTAEAFVEHRLHGVTLSQSAWSVIKRKLSGESVTQEQSGLGKREWSELQALLGE
jgi:thymidylate synthase (FAD)